MDISVEVTSILHFSLHNAQWSRKRLLTLQNVILKMFMWRLKLENGFAWITHEKRTFEDFCQQLHCKRTLITMQSGLFYCVIRALLVGKRIAIRVQYDSFYCLKKMPLLIIKRLQQTKFRAIRNRQEIISEYRKETAVAKITLSAKLTFRWQSVISSVRKNRHFPFNVNTVNFIH